MRAVQKGGAQSGTPPFYVCLLVLFPKLALEKLHDFYDWDNGNSQQHRYAELIGADMLKFEGLPQERNIDDGHGQQE